MRALVDELMGRLRAFVAQDAAVLLVVEVNDASNGFVVKALDSIDQESADMFWSFADDFVNAAAFVDAMASYVQRRRELANKALTKEGRPTWPEVPGPALDRLVSPVERVRSLMVYARDLSSDLEAMHLVWNVFPASILDPIAYRNFVLELMAHEFPQPWCHHMRVLVRDDIARPSLRDIEDIMNGAEWYAPRLSQEDIAKAFEDEAGDESLPLDERIQALLTLAGLDYAHKRLPEALDKYQLAGRYYAAKGKLALYALTLNGMGEVHARAGRPDEARQHFESALTPAMTRIAQDKEPGHIDAVPVLLNITLNLANLHLEQQRWTEAGTYYEGARDIAHGMRNVQMKIQCIENIGVCHFQLGNFAEAAKAWDEGTALARTMDATEHLRTLLYRQREAYARLGLHDRREAAEAELRRLPGGLS